MNSNPFAVRQPVLPHSSNVTEQFLRDVGHDHTTLHELYKYVLDDVPDPLHPGQLLTYGQVLADVATSIGTERANAYARAQGFLFQETAASYAARQYDEARGRLFARAAAAPDKLVFSTDAVEAFAAPRRQKMMTDPNYTAPTKTGQMMNPSILRQLFAAKPDTSSCKSIPAR